MRELEQKNGGSGIKVKKYETLIIQVWSLLPQFCMANSPNMIDCFGQIIKYLEPIINKNVLGLRPIALKAFSSLIYHCRHTKVVDVQIKRTRAGLQNISQDYIQSLVALYSEDGDDTAVDGDHDMLAGGAPTSKLRNKKEYRTTGQAAILDTL